MKNYKRLMNFIENIAKQNKKIANATSKEFKLADLLLLINHIEKFIMDNKK